MPGTTRSLAATAAALIALSAAPAAAAAGAARSDEEKARMHWERGAELYDAGDHAGAIAEWEEGYVLSERPEFLLNIAQAYRELDEADRALYYYRLYLKKKPGASDAAEVRDIIAELESEGATGAAPKGGGRAGRGDGDGDGTGRGPMAPEEERLRLELGSSYDAYLRSGLTVEGFRKVRTGKGLMGGGGVCMGAGAALVIVSFLFDPGTRTALEYTALVGGVVVFAVGAYLLYYGYAAWASGRTMARGPGRGAAADRAWGVALLPAPGPGATLALAARW